MGAFREGVCSGGGGEMVKFVNPTIDYYNQNADQFVEGTLYVDFADTQDRFLEYLKEGSRILDFGCGSGRDTKYFLTRGYRVDAIDGSIELCKTASIYTGVAVKQMLFSELDEHEKYDGIWACSSILHLSKNELRIVLQKIAAALKPGGIVYTSFKYGEFEGEVNGRYFTYFTLENFTDFMENIKELQMKDHWITGDARPGRGEEKWLNLILKKPDIH